MTPLLSAPRATLPILAPTRGMSRREAEIIAARIASARHWRRRRAWLRLRATLFGRGKAPPAARSAAPRPPQAKSCPPQAKSCPPQAKAVGTRDRAA